MDRQTMSLARIFDPPTLAHQTAYSSSSAFSLQTLPSYTTLDPHQDPIVEMTENLSKHVLTRKRGSRMSTTTVGDEASFVTARGTLRSVRPDGTINDEDVLVWIGPEHLQAPESPISTIRTSPSDNDETPFPSRVLRLYHPPKEGKGVQHRIDRFFEVDSWELIASAKESVERAFWGMIMPSIAGLKGIGETVTEVVGGLTLPIMLTLSTESPSIIDSDLGPGGIPDQLHQPRLYADETVYTLRLPKESAETLDLDLGNTARPIMVRKRAAIPDWDGKSGKGLGWGREVAQGWR